MSKSVKYQFYPSLLDKFTRFNNELCTLDELIDYINRVPGPRSEAAEKGIAFNKLTDLLLAGSDVSEADIDGNILYHIILQVGEENANFFFDKRLTDDIVERLRGAIPQQFVEGFISTSRGLVRLYGFADYILRNACVDLKSCGRYEFWQYRDNWQQHVYPLCLRQMGMQIDIFDYLITDFDCIYSEPYILIPHDSETKVKLVVEDFIDFLETHRDRITDKRIFNLK